MTRDPEKQLSSSSPNENDPNVPQPPQGVFDHARFYPNPEAGKGIGTGVKYSHPTLGLCECGGSPHVFRMPGSHLGLRGIACNHCKSSGVLRITTEDAIVEWNKGRRVYRQGEYVYTP